MIYLYLTKSMYLCTSKKSNFSNYYRDCYVQIPDESLNNPITVELIGRFKSVLEDYNILDSIRQIPKRTSDELSQKLFLKDFGLTESYINQEYSTTYNKYSSYYNRIETAYNMFNRGIELYEQELKAKKETEMMGLSATNFIKNNLEEHKLKDGRYSAIQGVCRNGLLVSFLLNGYSTVKDGTSIEDCNFKNIEVAFENFEYMDSSIKKCMSDYCDKFQKPVVYTAYMPMAYVEDIIGSAGGILGETFGLHETLCNITDFDEYLRSI